MQLRSSLASLALLGFLFAAPADASDPFFPEFGDNAIDVEHYDLALDVDPAANHLAGKAVLTTVALQRLQTFTLDFTGLAVSSVRLDGRPAAFALFGGKLAITPARTVAKGDVFRLAIDYAGTPAPIQDPTAPGDPTLKLGWFGYKGATYVVSEPVGASTFFPANDQPTDKATFRIAVTVPAGYIGLANGVLKSTTAIGRRTRTVWDMAQPMTTWLATVHVNRFRVALTHTSHGKLVRVYTTKRTPPADVKGYLRAAAMIPYLEERIGPYPFGGYGSVVVDDPALYYALETQAMIAFPLGAADDAFVAHELTHQWFGDSVSVRKWADLWIAEGTATYFEVLWPNRNAPAAFDKAMRDLYDYVAEHKLGPVVVDEPEEIFGDRVYLRGAATLYALRQTVGDPTFFRILRRFQTDFRGGNASSADFIRTAVFVSGRPAVQDLLRKFLYAEVVPPLPGESAAAAAASAARGPAPRPDVVGLRCGRGSRAAARAHCGLAATE